MTRKQLERLLVGEGFSKQATEAGRLRFARRLHEIQQHCALDNVRGAAWRWFLAVGAVPESWPVSAVGVAACEWVEAESPWFEYFNDLDPNDPEDAQFKDKGEALDQCSRWLFDVGLTWLADPGCKSPEEWREQANILVREPR